MSQPDRISVFFEIMEFEAWILGMYDLFMKIDPRLSAENIEKSTGIDLRIIDPQTQFYRPATVLEQILAIAGIEYKKKFGDIEKLSAPMNVADFESAIERGRCASFREFYTEIKACAAES